jgi:hypothetical protein
MKFKALARVSESQLSFQATWLIYGVKVGVPSLFYVFRLQTMRIDYYCVKL